MRFLISLLIVTIVLSYMILPLIKHFHRLYKIESKRIGESFNFENEENDKDE
jgi:antibiotic biosynthesis monooxygenase (ABM) superfamily enzyme